MTNGAGGLYPDRLKEAEIPGLVRTVTTCYIHAALIESPSFKVRVDASSAYAILDSMAGRLNADLVRAFESVAVAFGSIEKSLDHPG